MALGTCRMCGPCPSTAVCQVMKRTLEYTPSDVAVFGRPGQPSAPDALLKCAKMPTLISASIGMHCLAMSVIMREAHTSLCVGRQEGHVHLLATAC